jgi:hypothetical protein
MSICRVYTLEGRGLEILGVLRKRLIAGGRIGCFKGGDLHGYVL